MAYYLFYITKKQYVLILTAGKSTFLSETQSVLENAVILCKVHMYDNVEMVIRIAKN